MEARGAQQTTLVNPSENFFRFNMDGAQWMAGLGDYVFHEKGYKTVATLGEDYSFMYTQVFGFALEYCAAGGKITERLWVPLGTKDFGSIIAALPDDVDAIYLGLGGGDAVNFLNQYQQTDGDAALIGSTIMIDQSVLSSKGRAKKALIGTPGAGPQADSWDDPNWQRFVKTYQDAFPPEQRFSGPSLLATSYYNAATAVFGCLDKIDGDLSDGHRALRQCLSTTDAGCSEWHDPAGRQPPGDRRQLSDGGCRGRWRAGEPAGENHPAGEPDARISGGAVRRDRCARPRGSGLQDVLLTGSGPSSGVRF